MNFSIGEFCLSYQRIDMWCRSIRVSLFFIRVVVSNITLIVMVEDKNHSSVWGHLFGLL